jgi:ribosomal protein L7/L12
MEFRWLGFAGSRLTREVKELCDRELRIKAIKLYRERTGTTLKDAKDAVDRIAPWHPGV